MLYLGRDSFYDEEKNQHYFILKIGYTEDTNKDKRLLMYTSHNPSFKFLYTILGGTKEHEGKLLEKFKHLLHHGNEWFVYSQEIIDYFISVSLEDIDKLPIPLLALERRNKCLLKNREFMFIFERVLKEELENNGRKFTTKDFKTILQVVSPESTTSEKVLEDIRSSGHFPKFSALHLSLSDIIPSIENEEVKNFFSTYDKLTTYVEKIRMIVDFLIDNSDIRDLIINNLADSDKIKQQLITVGEIKIRSLGYHLTKINKAMGITIFDLETLNDTIYSTFKAGERYTKRFIKEKLGEIYKKSDFNGTPKANDLENWFEIRSCKLTIDGKREHGFELLSIKTKYK